MFIIYYMLTLISFLVFGLNLVSRGTPGTKYNLLNWSLKWFSKNSFLSINLLMSNPVSSNTCKLMKLQNYLNYFEKMFNLTNTFTLLIISKSFIWIICLSEAKSIFMDCCFRELVLRISKSQIKTFFYELLYNTPFFF